MSDEVKNNVENEAPKVESSAPESELKENELEKVTGGLNPTPPSGMATESLKNQPLNKVSDDWESPLQS
jgi:hypothetical protein